MINKRGFEFSFGWMFAIIVGAVIILLAIYAASKLVNQEGVFVSSSSAKEFGILTSSFETSLEEDKPDSIAFPVKSIIFNECVLEGNFGKQKISVAESKNEDNPGIASSFANKYYFSESEVKGKRMLVWSKPVKMPFKVADIMYIWSEEDRYCFVDTPQLIEDNLERLRRNNPLLNQTIIFASSFDKDEKCKKALDVCFGGSLNCDINVMENKVRKNGKEVYYGVINEDYTFLYGAIFSAPDIYECQVKRLMKRATNLALLYKSKSEMLGSEGCGSSLQSSLMQYAQAASGFKNSQDISQILITAKELGVENEALSCPLF